MRRILSVLAVVCLVGYPGPSVQAESLATTAGIAGNAEAPGGEDLDMGVLGSSSVAFDFDPEFGAASVDATVAGPSLRVFGFASSFAGPAWIARGDTIWSDVLRFRFPADSVTGMPQDILVEFVASFDWTIESNGQYGITLQGKSANFNPPQGEQFDDFGNVPAGMSGFVEVSASVPFDSLGVDPEDSSKLLGEVALTMQMDGGAGAGEFTHGSWATASGEFDFNLVDIVVHGIASEAQIESDSGLSYEFEVVTADFDDDGDVDGRDFLIWQRGFGTTGADLGNGDANGDGDVDGDDLGVWQSQYGQPGQLAAIVGLPEPATATIGIVAFVAGVSRAKRRG